MKNFRATKLLPTAVLITMLLFSGSKANAEGLTLYETLKQTDKDPYSYDMSANENVTQDLGDYGKNSNNFTINGNNHQIIGNAHTGIEPSDQNLFIHNVNNTGDMSTATSGMSGFNKALALYGWGRTISSIITNSIFNDNNNNTSEGLGGAISMGGSSNSGSTNLTITNAVFKNNTATNYGGAIFVGKNSKVTLENVKFIDNKANGLAKDIINEGTLIFKNDLATDSLTTNITNRGGTYAGLGTVEFENTTMDFKEYPFILIDQGLSIDPHSKVTATAEQLQGLRYVENKGEFIFSAGSEDNLYGIELWGSGATTFTADSYITNKSGKNFGGDLGTIINQGYLELISNGPRGTIKNDNILKLKFLGTTTDNTIKLYAIIAGTGETIIPTGYSIDNNLKTIKQNKLTIEQGATAILKLDNITADIVNDGSITVAYNGEVNNANNITGDGDITFPNDGWWNAVNTGILSQKYITNKIDTRASSSVAAFISDATNLITPNDIANSGTMRLYGKLSNNIIGITEAEVVKTGTVKINNETDKNVLTINDDLSIAGTFDLNSQTLSMQEATGEAAKYSTLTVDTSKGTGDFKIDVNMAKNERSKYANIVRRN